MNNKLASRIIILPIWTDIDSIRNRIVTSESDLKHKFPEFRKIILIVARLESEKNIELSLLAFKKIMRLDGGIGLVIVGSGSKKEWLEKLVKSLNIETGVRFIGWMSDVASLFKSSDLLLITSFYEGYGLSIVEAMACGCPVVSTDVGVARQVGATIVPYDAGQIALDVVEVLNQDQKSKIDPQFIISKQEYLNRFKGTFRV
jgi:glycosyltransferase involved in cell wall biosynthesis